MRGGNAIFVVCISALSVYILFVITLGDHIRYFPSHPPHYSNLYHVKTTNLRADSSISDSSTPDSNTPDSTPHSQPDKVEEKVAVEAKNRELSPKNKPPGFVCQTTKGEFEVKLQPDLAPKSVDRLLKMVNVGFFDQGIVFFRVNQWITQFGADQTNRKPEPFPTLRGKAEQDTHPFGPGEKGRRAHPWPRGTFAWIGGTQMIIVRKANAQMGTNPQDAPAGMVVRGMDVIDSLDNSYGNAIDSGGKGPDQVRIMQSGNDHIKKEFPKTDFILSCKEVV